MSANPDRGDRRIIAFILLLACAVFSLALWHARRSGVIQIDDAFITFRYAENLARGNGFVFNPGERLLGTTTPLFCLLLALLRLLGCKPTLGADLLNLLAAIFSAGLVFLIGREAKNRALGLTAAILLIFFPHLWMNLGSGMETMFTIFLALLLVWLDLKNRPAAAGIVAAAMLLTRIDTLALLAGVLLVRFFQNRKQALILAFACLAALVPWLIFSFSYFGSPIPHSLLAKKLIHPLFASLVFKKYLYWFFGLQEQGSKWVLGLPILIAYTLFAVLGAGRAVWRERKLLVFILWIGFFFAGMVYGRVGPFHWYRIPMLSGYLILAALGIQWVSQAALRRNQKLADGLSVFLAISLAACFIYFLPAISFEKLTDKEKANFAIAQKAKELARPGDKILAGEVGMIGYQLLDYYVIDSAGLVSGQVYQIRKREKENLIKLNPNYRWDWGGTPGWVKAVLSRERPEFIISELKYLHLKTLVNDPWFQEQYQVIGDSRFERSAVILFQRKGRK